MKRKVINTIIDIALMVGVFAVVDLLTLIVFHKESIWLDIGLYIAVYIIVFGVKAELLPFGNAGSRTAMPIKMN